MGNHLSCVSSASLKRLQAAPHCSTQDLIKNLHCESGVVSELKGPVTTAEVMLEFPGQFLACFSNVLLGGGRRICAMRADEELRTAELYLLLPMHRLNTRFSSEELAFFATLTAPRASEKSLGRSVAILQRKDVALFAASMASSNAENSMWQSKRSISLKQNDAEAGMQFQGPATSLYMRGGAENMMCRSKSWMPRLQTIRESAVA